MSYKVYTVKENNAISIRTSTDGYQPKFLVENGKYFVKVQCELAGTLRDDWRVEDIASRICTQSGIYSVHQKPCRVKIITKTGRVKNRLGVVSDNFERYGTNFVSFNRLLNMCKYMFNMQEYNKSSNRDKLGMLIKASRQATGIPIQTIARYFYDMVTVDMLVLNQDRHFKNFGAFYNMRTGRMEVARLFDFGMGLFENDTIFDDTPSLKDCMRYSYISPFSEDPFVLLQDLLGIESYKRYLNSLNIGSLNLSSSMFPSKVAYEYYKKMRGEMLNARYIRHQ